MGFSKTLLGNVVWRTAAAVILLARDAICRFSATFEMERDPDPSIKDERNHLSPLTAIEEGERGLIKQTVSISGSAKADTSGYLP